MPIAHPRQFLDGEFAVFEDRQQIVGQIRLGFVQLVDQQHPRQPAGQESGAQRAEPDEIPDRRLLGPAAALGLSRRRGLHPADRVVAVQPGTQRGVTGDRPAQHPAQPQFPGDPVRETGLPGSRIPRDQQRPPQIQRSVDHVEFVGVGVGLGKRERGAEMTLRLPVVRRRHVVLRWRLTTIGTPRRRRGQELREVDVVNRPARALINPPIGYIGRGRPAVHGRVLIVPAHPRYPLTVESGSTAGPERLPVSGRPTLPPDREPENS